MTFPSLQALKDDIIKIKRAIPGCGNKHKQAQQNSDFSYKDDFNA